MLAARPAKRAAEKARRKERRAAAVAAGEPVPPPRKRPRGAEVTRADVTFVLDCAFDDKMTDKDIHSLASQLKYCYSVNRAAAVRPRLLATSFNGKLKARFEEVLGQYTAWSARDMAFSGDDMSSLWLGEGATLAASDFVYLTADSPNVLETLDDGKAYVLGALVDHNRYKNICLDRAKALGVAHAQLPIAEHVNNLEGRRVLTVNQVMEIMIAYLAHRDWAVAFAEAIPKRKLKVAPDDGPAEEAPPA